MIQKFQIFKTAVKKMAVVYSILQSPSPGVLKLCEISISEKRNNITACQMLTNLCVLLHSQLGDRSNPYSACSLLKTLTTTQFSGGIGVILHRRPGWLVLTCLYRNLYFLA